MLQDVRWLANELARAEVLNTLHVADVMGLLEFKLLKMKDLAGAVRVHGHPDSLSLHTHDKTQDTTCDFEQLARTIDDALSHEPLLDEATWGLGATQEMSFEKQMDPSDSESNKGSLSNNWGHLVTFNAKVGALNKRLFERNNKKYWQDVKALKCRALHCSVLRDGPAIEKK